MAKNLNFIVVVPARFASKRLPGKPLKNIAGLPMIVRTCKQCLKVIDKNRLVVATDDQRIKKICEKYSLRVIITSKRCKTGTDRVAEVAKKIKAKNYINVQGDEPLFNPTDLKKMITKLKTNKERILLGYTNITKKSDYLNKNVPKVVFDKNENLLYASRAPIPWSKKFTYLLSWRQVLVYSFPRMKLLKFSKARNKTRFENNEDIEILRFLEIGYNVKLIKMSNNSHPVDTIKDLNYVKNFLTRREKVKR